MHQFTKLIVINFSCEPISSYGSVAGNFPQLNATLRREMILNLWKLSFSKMYSALFSTEGLVGCSKDEFFDGSSLCPDLWLLTVVAVATVGPFDDCVPNDSYVVR